MFRVLLLATLCFSLGCTRRPPYTLARYGSPLLSKPDDQSVEVHHAAPDRPIKEIGEVATKTTNPQVAIDAILEGARMLGADGVVLAGPAGVAQSNSIIPGKATKSKQYGIKAIAFVYADSTLTSGQGTR